VCDFINSEYLCEFLLSYGDTSELVGILVNDVVHFGSLQTQTVFGSITIETGNFQTAAYEGILGLAQNSELMTCQPTCVTPLFDTYVENLKVPNSFEMNLKEEGGWLVFGGYNKSNPNLSWTKNTDDNYYGIRVSSISVLNSSLDYEYSQHTFIVDSGTSLMMLQQDLFSLIENAFNELCSTISPDFDKIFCSYNSVFNSGCFPSVSSNLSLTNFPLIWIEIDSAGKFPISAKEYLSFMQYRTDIFGDVETGYCFLIASVGDLAISVNILGDTFMRSFDSIVFDRDRNLLGFNSVYGNHQPWVNYTWLYILIISGVIFISLVVLIIVIILISRRRRAIIRI